MRQGKLIIGIVAAALTFSSVIAYGEPKMVTFDVTEQNAETVTLTGILKKPEGTGPFPAIVLLHSCDGTMESIWASRLHD